MTLIELYNQKKKMKNPAEEFIDEIAAITCRQSATVYLWMLGTRKPNRTACERISMALKIPVYELFPWLIDSDDV